MSVKLVSMNSSMKDEAEQCARLLVEGFRDVSRAWPDLESAAREVERCLKQARLIRLLVEDGKVAGWTGALQHYGGRVWEVHPLVVSPGRQGRGFGRALLADLESQALAAGALTLWAGCDDEMGKTSLADADLYGNISKAIATVRNPGHHPYEFYLKCGFTITGVLPDANGEGRPDIFLAKKILPQDHP